MGEMGVKKGTGIALVAVAGDFLFENISLSARKIWLF